MMRRKWKSRRGETLIETLISLFISSLALTMLAGMIFKSAQLLNKGMADMQGYTEEVNFWNNPTSVTSGMASELSRRANKKISVGSGATVTISVSSGDAENTFQVNDVWYVLDDTGGKPVVSYVKSGS